MASEKNTLSEENSDSINIINEQNNVDRGDAPQQQEILLEETFYILSKKNTVFRVRLTREGLSLVKECNGTSKEQTIKINDIIGCRCMRSKRNSSAGSCVCNSLTRAPALRVVDETSSERDESDVSAYLYIYAYILKRSKKSSKRERTTITLRFRSFDKYEDNNREAQRWRSTIKALLAEKRTPSVVKGNDEKKVLVLLNPKSGPGKARETFQQKVVPVLTEAEIQYDLHVTKHANYAREFVRQRDVYQYKGIVVIGGDGILFEVINGLFERQDWELAVQIPLGIVPSGSGNGLAKTISHCYEEPYAPNPVLGAALTIARGNSTPMDLVRVETTSQILFSFLSVGWGLLSDIDIESERLRAIGGQRFTVWSVARLIGLRTYKGRVFYLPCSENGMRRASSVGATCGTGDADFGDCNTDYSSVQFCTEKTISSDPTTDSTSQRQRLDSWYSAASRPSAYHSIAATSYRSAEANVAPNRMFGPASQLPALTAPVPPHWCCLEGPFVLVHAAYQTHLSSDCLFAPRSTLNDGIIWLCVMRAGITRAQLLTFLLGLSSGSHALSDTTPAPLLMIPVQAFRIVPDPDTSGYITVDGERVEYGPIQAEMFSSISNVMVP